MSAYEDLVDDCHDKTLVGRKDIRAVFAFALRTLETVTPEMVDAWNDERTPEEIAFPTATEYASGSWLAMLRASPLMPTKEKTP